MAAWRAKPRNGELKGVFFSDQIIFLAIRHHITNENKTDKQFRKLFQALGFGLA